MVLELGPMGEAFEAMRGCTRDLLKKWGYPKMENGRNPRPIPMSPPNQWVTASDYPKEMLRLGKIAIIHFRMTVGRDGKPTACHIQRSIGRAEFDKAMCDALMKRASFRPAVNESGEAVPSYFISTTTFVIGKQ